MHFVNWQRKVSVEELNGQKVVVKRNKPTKSFHEFLIVYAYSLLSILLARPSAPPNIDAVQQNEDAGMRMKLKRMGILTPELISISDTDLVEEYVEGGDLYKALAWLEANVTATDNLAFHAGCLTGRLHRAGYVYTDNKAQNYLIKGASVIMRTDLGFIKKNGSQYSRSMDIGSFLASVMDLACYRNIEKAFYEGYLSETGRGFPYLSIAIRNILSVGFSSNLKTTVRNMMTTKSSRLLDFAA